MDFEFGNATPTTGATNDNSSERRSRSISRRVSTVPTIVGQVASSLRSSLKRTAADVTGRLARHAAREFAAELDRVAPQSVPGQTPIRVDVEDLLRQLSSSRSRQQLNHFFAWNHRWVALLSERNRRTAADVYDFIDSEMPDAVFVLNQFAVLETNRDDVLALNGAILDLGVYKGASTRQLATIFPDVTIDGFDSFEGLPEDWSHTLRGDFGDIQGALPDVPANVRLFKGWFDETLPVWKEQHDGQPISLLRVDCDIYSSTRTIFDIVGDLLQPGSWILFDELIGYRGWRSHEHRAFMEFVSRTDARYDYVAYGLTYTLVRLR